MRVQLLKRWKLWKVGDTINVQPNLGRLLVKQGTAEETEQEEHATAEPNAERAVAKPRPKRKTTSRSNRKKST